MANFKEQHGDALAAAGALVWFQIATTLKQGGQFTAYQISGVVNLNPVLDFFVGYGWLTYQGDPEDILDDVVIELATLARSGVPINKGPADAVLALRSHYLGESK